MVGELWLRDHPPQTFVHAPIAAGVNNPKPHPEISLCWHQCHNQREGSRINASAPTDHGNCSGIVTTGGRILHEGELNIRGLGCTDRQRNAHRPLVATTQVDQFPQRRSNLGIAIPRWIFELPLVGVGNIDLLVAAKRSIGGIGSKGNGRASRVPKAGRRSKTGAIEEDPGVTVEGRMSDDLKRVARGGTGKFAPVVGGIGREAVARHGVFPPKEEIGVRNLGATLLTENLRFGQAKS